MDEQTTQYFVVRLTTTTNKPFLKNRIIDAINHNARMYDLGPQVVEIMIIEEGPPARESSWERHGDYDG